MIVAALIMGFSMPKGTVASERPDNSTILEASKNVQPDKENDSLVKNDSNNDVVSESLISDSQSENKPDEIEAPDVTGEGVLELADDTKEDEITSKDNQSENKNDSAASTSHIDPMPEDETGFVSLGEAVEIKVISGDSSVSVSRRMLEAGLVESAVEFDAYLCANKYDKFICVGTYDIPKGSDFETMAKIITRRNY